MKSFSSRFFAIILLSVAIVNHSVAQKEIWSTFGEHTKSQFTYRPLDFSGFTSASPGKVSVDAFGDFNFSIPLFDVPGRKLSYPLNLIYTPGIKVTQEASWVGLGWSFSDSYVERKVISSMDDNLPEDKANIYDADQYFVKLPDGRTAMINQHNPNDAAKTYMEFKIGDGKGWKVEYENARHRFIVTDESGITYVFTDAMLGYYYDRGHLREPLCNSSGGNRQRFVEPPLNEPFVKWHLTAILYNDYDDNDPSVDADVYDPLDNTPSHKPKGSWIRIVNELNDTQDKDWRYYTMRQMANTDINDCSENVGESIWAYWIPSRLFELTYPKYIITPTHIVDIETEVEPFNPIADLLEDKYGVFNEFRGAPDYPFSWEFYDKFDEEDLLRSEKGRRITAIKIYKNLLSPIHSTPVSLSNPIKSILFEYFTPGEGLFSFYEERSMLKKVSINPSEEKLEYKFYYHNVLTSNDVQTVSVGGVNRNILKCYTSSWQHKGCEIYTGPSSINPNPSEDDFSSPVVNYYRGAFNAATSSSIGADGYLNRNTTLQNAFDNYTFDYSSLEDDAVMWSLASVEFPNGSSQEFEYQSDRYVADFYHRGKDILTETFGPTTSRINWGFGIRLKSQTLKGGDGGDKTYSYEYASLDEHTNPGDETWWDGVANGGSITEGVGRIYGDPIEIRAPDNCSTTIDFDGFQCRQEVIPPTDHLSNQTERRVIYGRIKENQPDGSAITSYYNVANLEENRSSLPSSDIGKFNEIMGKRGQVKRVKYHNNTGELVYVKEKNITELLQSGITDQNTWRYFTYWTSSVDETSTTKYSNQDLVSTSSTSFIEESGMVRDEKISDPAGDPNTSFVTSYKYRYETDTSFETANRLSDPDEVTQKKVVNTVPTILNTTKYNYNTEDRVTSITSGYGLGNEIDHIKDILYDQESMPYQFSDAKGVKYAVHYTTKTKVPTAIFSNAEHSKTLFEDFEDGNHTSLYRSGLFTDVGAWQIISGTWEVEKGRLKHTGGTGLIYHDLLNTFHNGNQNIEFDVYPRTSGVDSEFRFRVNPAHTTYYKLITRNTQAGTKDIKLYKNSTLKSLGSLVGIVNDYSDPVHIKVKINGNQISVFVNGKNVITYTDSTIYTYGGIGFYASSANSQQFFDNIRIYPLDAKAVSQSLEDRFLKISELSDMNGVKSYHKYDELGRLELTLDHKETLQGQGIYSVKNSTEEISSYVTNTPIRRRGLIGYWRYDNSIKGFYEGLDTKIEGVALDANGLHAQDEYINYYQGRVGKGLYTSSDVLSGSPLLINYGDLNRFEQPTSFTFAGWFYREPHPVHMINFSNLSPLLVTSEGVHNILVAKSSVSSGENTSLQLGTNGANIELYMNSITGGAGKETVNAGIQDNQWYHIALTYNTGDITNTTQLYLDGELIKTWGASYWYDNLYSNNSPLTFGGANPTSPDGLFNGKIDEFLLFEKVLTPDEIKSLTDGVIESTTNSDKLGNVTQESSAGRTGSATFSTLSIDHDYDIKGRKIATTRPNSTEKVGTTYYQDPLNRVYQIKLPATGGTVPTTTLTYNSNTSSEQFTSFDSYTAGTLHKVVTNDPNGKQTIEYTNSIGQTIASIVDMDGNGAKSTGDLVTEFGYDDRGNLTKIKDPRGLTTQYEYDIHSRLTRKKLPDQDNWVDYKYDKAGNVRFVETAEHKKSGSSSTVTFNELGSADETIVAAKTGVLKFDVSISDMEFGDFTTQLKDASQANVTIFEGEIQHDDGWEVSDWQELSVSAGTYRFHGTVQNQNDGWSDVSGTFSFKPYTFSYTKYDNLNRITEVGEYYGSTSFASADATNASFPGTDTRILIAYKYDEENGYSGARNLAGNLAQVWYYNPNAFRYGPSKTYYSYNEQGLVEWIVQELRRDNGLSITKTIEYEYDKAGNLLELRYNPGGSDSFYQRYTYDGLSRVIKAETSLTGNADEWLTSAEYTYKSDGQVEQLILGENAQTVDYTYDNRGWLTGINNSGSVGSGPQQDRFFQALDYFSTSVPSSKRQYNGNIAKQSWGFDTQLINKPDQTYTYTYDNANRLTYADRSGSGYTSTAFDVGPLTYDLNGNIRTVYRRNENGSLRDGDHFGYFSLNRETNSNRITNIEDIGPIEFFDVDYDANGNLIKNDLHNLKKTTFDLANMPVRSISGSGVVQYRYGPDGQRVAKSVFGGTGTLYVRGAGGETLAVYDHNGNLLFHNVLVGSEIIGKTN